MRRILFAVALSAAVIASVRAQIPPPTVRSSVSEGFETSFQLLDAYYHTLVRQPSSPKSRSGALTPTAHSAIPDAIFEGAAMLPVVDVLCAATPNQRKLLLPTSRAGVADLEQKLLSSSLCGGGCTCKPLKRMRFKEDYSYDWSAAKPFYTQPRVSHSRSRGGAIGGIVLATNGSDGEDGNRQPVAVNCVQMLGDYRLSAAVQQRSACNYNPFTAIVTFSGTESGLQHPDSRTRHQDLYGHRPIRGGGDWVFDRRVRYDSWAWQLQQHVHRADPRERVRHRHRNNHPPVRPRRPHLYGE